MKRVAVCLMLLSCARTETVFAPVEVEIPIAVPCPAFLAEKPDFAMGGVTGSDSLDTKTRAALIELNQRRAYETEMEAWIAACSGP
ncbi:MAG: hypothetical protein PHE27_04745 [Alphaproteobacteria bacterium]|nr:hypothetical protein [Alphaproteobacteria bacterium]